MEANKSRNPVLCLAFGFWGEKDQGNAFIWFRQGKGDKLEYL